MKNFALSSLKQASVPSFYKAQKLLDEFRIVASKADEKKRIFLAEKLVTDWKKQGLSLNVLPAVPKRQDYWYLIQLLALDRHIDLDQKELRPIRFKLDTSELIWIEIPTIENNKNNLSPLLKLATRFYPKPFDPSTATRQEIDHLVSSTQVQVLDQLGLEPSKYQLSLIHFHDFIRLAPTLGWGELPEYTLLRGYRLRADGKLTGLIGGHKSFGGSRFVDSFWTNQYIEAKVRLAIYEK